MNKQESNFFLTHNEFLSLRPEALKKFLTSSLISSNLTDYLAVFLVCKNSNSIKYKMRIASPASA